jgi:tetratricopeptide (TPR) repeat protein/tRNA A-37 threonylcarbamoyl transferase component Bud32
MEQFGKYSLIRKIGTGGMAEVFLARTTVAQGLNKTLVIKKIHGAYARSRPFVAMFVDEAKIALGLNHPNIIQVFDFGAVADTYFLAMEYVEGVDLLRLLQEAAKARQRLSYGLSAYIVQQLAKGLDYAHRKADDFGQPLGIVHRDISPQNILLSWDGSVKIVDFGIARARDVHEEEGVIKGKYAYMSPEQARGEPVDCRSDVFAAGIVLFELVCARPLFHGKGKDVLDMVKSGTIPPPRELAPDLPESLERIILRALAFDRAARFQTARDLQHELGKFQLEWGQKTGALIDSGALAQTLAQLVPQERTVAPRPPPVDVRATPVARPGAPIDPTGEDPRPAGRAVGVPTPRDTASPIARGTPDANDAPDASEGADDSDPGGGDAGEPFTAAGSSARSAPAAPPVVHSMAEILKQARPPTPQPAVGREPRERKYIYVLEGVLRGMAALERRLGAGGAARLVDEFYKVARDVAFKHDALLDAPRSPADGRAERSDPIGSGPGPATGDGHETTLRVIVGLPVPSEDDAGRALKLALALVDALDGIGSDVEPELRLALAVQRGVALVKRDRAQPAFEIEDATAAFAGKLARQARGAEILVGGRVFRAARAEWNFEALAAIDLPEESAGTSSSKIPIDDDTEPGVKRARVYRLRGPKERSQRLRERRDAGRLYGRALELKALRDAWRDVLVTRRKRQIIIIGDAGVGKRRLVRTFLEGLSPSEAVVIQTSARVGTAMTPYGVIADLARDVLGLAEDAEPHEVERRLLRTLPVIFPGEESSREAQTALQILGMLLGARGATPAAEVDAETRRQTLIHVLGRVERRLESDKPLVLFGEDVHWADQDSQELFAALLKIDTARPIFGVMTSRPDPRIQRLAKDLGTEIVLLDELSDDTRREMLAERLVPGPDMDALVDRIAARCGGNAFFIQELLDTLVERGILVPDRDDQEHPGLLRWVKRDAPIHVPSTIEDLILSRIDALPVAERDALVHAAVLGRQVSPTVLAGLLGRPVRLELDELARRGLLSPRPELDEYRFKNDMTMTVAYGLLAPEARVQLHRAVAARIAGAPGYRLGQDDALIARHLELAGDGAPAAERYLRAAGHAVELGGHADAFRQLARTLKLLAPGDHERRFTAHRLREEILRRLARRPQQLRELHALRKEAEALGHPSKLAAAHCALAQFYIDVGKAPAALRAVAPAIPYARDAGDALLEAEALRLRAAIARLVGNAEESLRLVEQALALCDSTGTPDAGRPPTPVLTARATILGQRGAALWNMGRLEAAIESYAEALVIYRALGMGRNEARALNNMGIVFAALGEYEEALAHYKSALKLDQALDDRSSIAQKLGSIGRCYADLGDVERADSYLGKALEIAEQTDDLSAAADAAVSWGQAKMQRGLGKAGLELLERGLALATENRDRYQEVRALQYIALAHLTVGNPPEAALEIARSATEWARKMPMPIGVIHGLAFQGMALSRLGRHAEAIVCVDDAVQRLEAARPEGVEHVHRWRAEVLAAAGQVDAARAALERANAEVDAKAAKLRDPELRKLFLASRQRSR